jgi:hypothetical protein
MPFGKKTTLGPDLDSAAAAAGKPGRKKPVSAKPASPFKLGKKGKPFGKK